MSDIDHRTKKELPRGTKRKEKFFKFFKFKAGLNFFGQVKSYNILVLKLIKKNNFINTYRNRKANFISIKYI